VGLVDEDSRMVLMAQFDPLGRVAAHGVKLIRLSVSEVDQLVAMIVESREKMR
jgi:hypothetical protein